jgi:hypothetical protein
MAVHFAVVMPVRSAFRPDRGRVARWSVALIFLLFRTLKLLNQKRNARFTHQPLSLIHAHL